jgi:hypothetical protein
VRGGLERRKRGRRKSESSTPLGAFFSLSLSPSPFVLFVVLRQGTHSSFLLSYTGNPKAKVACGGNIYW